LSACNIVRYVQHQAPHLHLKRAKLLTTALRSFLRYARYRGEVTLDLAAAVPVVANWSMPSIPRAIGADQIRQLLASIDRSTATGRRDYAILLLLARLGLRSGEVAFLELDDIDWDAGQMSVRGKRNQRTALPLPTDVGKAIAKYLQHDRPRSTSRRVFLRGKAPIRGFLSQSAVGSIVRHALQRAGVQAPTTGAHQFRHALATQMLHRGASLAEIGELLRHRNTQTTTIYAKVDLKALRTLALPWPGGVR
jgi:site-specific recombinase XerD